MSYNGCIMLGFHPRDARSIRAKFVNQSRPLQGGFFYIVCMSIFEDLRNTEEPDRAEEILNSLIRNFPLLHLPDGIKETPWKIRRFPYLSKDDVYPYRWVIEKEFYWRTTMSRPSGLWEDDKREQEIIYRNSIMFTCTEIELLEDRFLGYFKSKYVRAIYDLIANANGHLALSYSYD